MVKINDWVIVNNWRHKDIKAKIYNTDFGEVVLCVTEEGVTFSANIKDVSLFVEQPLPPAPLPPILKPSKERKYSNTIVERAKKSNQQSLF